MEIGIFLTKAVEKYPVKCYVENMSKLEVYLQSSKYAKL
jgi:hypothetical protein